MGNDSLEKLVETAVNKEKELTKRADELALQDKRFADYLAEKKHQDEALEVLWQMVKERMEELGLKGFENAYIRLTLTPSGKFRASDISAVDDDLCDIKKVLNNKKVKAYYELNGELPEGVESTGNVLRKTLL